MCHWRWSPPSRPAASGEWNDGLGENLRRRHLNRHAVRLVRFNSTEDRVRFFQSTSAISPMTVERSWVRSLMAATNLTAATFTLPYWLGRYRRFISPPAPR